MTLSELFDKADEMVAKRYPDCNASIKEMNSYRDGYIHGMTEKLEGMIPIERACKWITEHIDIPYEGRMIDGEPEAADYIEWAKERLKCAEEVAEAFRKAMEE